jgi:hypothetical protein
MILHSEETLTRFAKKQFLNKEKPFKVKSRKKAYILINFLNNYEHLKTFKFRGNPTT